MDRKQVSVLLTQLFPYRNLCRIIYRFMIIYLRFKVCLDRSCDMWRTIVMLENNFVVSLSVLWPFLLQCSAHTHQLRSIPIPCDGFTRFQQFIIHHTELFPPNTEHNFGTVNIRSGRWCGDMSGHYPFFDSSHNAMWKPFPFLFFCILIQIFIIAFKIGSFWANTGMRTVNPIFQTLLIGLSRYGL